MQRGRGPKIAWVPQARPGKSNKQQQVQNYPNLGPGARLLAVLCTYAITQIYAMPKSPERHFLHLVHSASPILKAELAVGTIHKGRPHGGGKGVSPKTDIVLGLSKAG